MSVGISVFLVYVISVLNMHYRGSVRFGWSRQILTHTNYLAPYNLLMNLFSKLPNRPLLETDAIADLKLLRDNWEVMRDEALLLSEQGQISASTGLNDLGFNSFFRTGWKRFYLKWYDDFLPSALAQCPKTLEILKQTKTVNAAMFASLPPGAVLKPHRDPYAGSLRYHLGLITPNDEDCYILVDGERHVWHDGHDVLFDETFIHEAHNNTEKQRIILFADIHRPTHFIDGLNRFISNNLLKVVATQNDETEKVGILNQWFAKLYGIRTYSRKLKSWNREVYYVLKYLLFIVAVYFLFF